MVKHLPSPQQVPMESTNQAASKETKSGLCQELSNISWQYAFFLQSRTDETLESITDSMDMGEQTLGDSGGCRRLRAAIHGVVESDMTSD